MRKFGTRFLPLIARGYPCRGGPLAGSIVFLTERSTNTAYIEWNGHVGHYIHHESRDGMLTLRWEPIKYADLQEFAG